MRNGFIKVAAATVEISVADVVGNSERIVECIKQADKQNVNLLILPELCVTGYSCKDLFFSGKLLSAAKKALTYICSSTKGKYTITAVGLPLVNNGKLFNCAAVIQNGKILGVIPKSYIPNHDEFCESRYFSSAKVDTNKTITIDNEVIPFGNNLVFKHNSIDEFTFGIEICEDVFVAEPVCTSLCLGGANIIGNLSATNEVLGKAERRRLLIESTSSRLMCGYVFAAADHSESTQDIVFSRHSMIYENGTKLAEILPFSDAKMIVSEIDVDFLAHERLKKTTFIPCSDSINYINFSQDIKNTFLSRTVEPNPFLTIKNGNEAEEILNIQSYGLKKRLDHTRANCAVIGISGGLDSTLALLVAVRTMKLSGRPISDIIAVTMPCFGTTERTKSNAVILCELLGVTLKTVDISSSVKQHFTDIGQEETSLDITYENAQARERTQVLMDIANMENGLVIGTGDLSELALGWATYNGDHMSMYGVNASAPKTLVKFLVQYEAEHSKEDLQKVLFDILNTPVSPELLPITDDGNMAQKTEDLVGPYELHDFFLFHTINNGETPRKIYLLAQKAFDGKYDNETILKWLNIFTRRFFNQQFKRSCLPDGPKVCAISLSPRGDWQMPSDATSTIWLQEIEKLK